MYVMTTPNELSEIAKFVRVGHTQKLSQLFTSQFLAKLDSTTGWNVRKFDNFR